MCKCKSDVICHVFVGGNGGGVGGWLLSCLFVVYLFVLFSTFNDLFLTCGWFDVGSGYVDFFDDNAAVDLQDQKVIRKRDRKRDEGNG